MAVPARAQSSPHPPPAGTAPPPPTACSEAGWCASTATSEAICSDVEVGVRLSLLVRSLHLTPPRPELHHPPPTACSEAGWCASTATNEAICSDDEVGVGCPCSCAAFNSTGPTEGDDTSRARLYLTQVQRRCLSGGRCFRYLVPQSVEGLMPLLIDLHGNTASSEGQALMQGGWMEFAYVHNVLAVWPEGVGKSWNAGNGWCGAARASQTDDIGFLDDVIADMQTLQAVDASRVYLAGHSCGCSMAQTYALRRSLQVAAMGCHAGYLIPSLSSMDQASFIPTPAWTVFGTSDSSSPYEAGAAQFGYIGAVESLQKWANVNGCTGDPVETWRVSDDYAQSYTACAGVTEVTLVTLTGVGHLPYKGVDTIVDTVQMAWNFMSRFTTELGQPPPLAPSPPPQSLPPLPPTCELSMEPYYLVLLSTK